jgi:hypothetical protein
MRHGPSAMPSAAEIMLLALPLMVLCLLTGLGLGIAVVANEGRGKVVFVSQLVGLINLALIMPLGLLAWAAETRDVRWMFMFAAAAFALIGLFGLRISNRYRE